MIGRLSQRVSRPALLVGSVVTLLVLSQLFPLAWPLGRIFQGAILGAASGLLALGLVLVYRTARVINFAYGAMGSCAAQVGIVCYEVYGLPWLACVVIALLAGAAIGVAVDAVLARFRNAPRLVVTVATIGLLQVLIGLQFGIAFWTGARVIVAPFATGLSETSFTVGTSVFNLNDALLLAVVPVAVIGLSGFLLRTDAGKAVRAIADNSERAALLGIPTHRLTRIVWILAGSLAGVVLMLAAPANGLPASPFVSVGGIFMPALAAAVIAKMEDLPVAFASGVGLGIFNAIVSNNVRKASVSTVALLVIILLALLVRKWSTSRAEAAESSWSLSGTYRPLPPEIAELPEVRVGRAGILAFLGVLAVAFPFLAPPDRIHTVAGYLILGLAVISLVILSGWAGTVSLGQFSIVGVGGVVGGQLIAELNLDLFLALVVAGVAGAAISVLLGLPALRVRPLFLAVTTLAFAAAMDQFFLNPANFPDQIPGSIVRPVLWKRFPLESERATYLLILAITVLAALIASKLRSARPGRILLASRDNDRAAAAMSVPVTRVRIAGMALAGIFAGVAGVLSAVLELGIGSSSFPPQTSVLIFSMAVVGGLSTVSGSLMGVAGVQLLIFLIGLLTAQGAQFASLGTGVLMLLVLIAFPGGISELVMSVRDRIIAELLRRRGLELQVGAADGSADIDEPSPEEAPTRVERIPAGSNAEPILRCEGVTASYGPLQVLFGVDLDVGDGEMVALLGTNGAGKSTVFKVVAGLLPPTGGEVTVDGVRIDGLRPDEIATRGLALMPGGRGVFPTMTVAENLRLACWQVRSDRVRSQEAVTEAIEMFPILDERADQMAGNLSGGEQQQLSLAMAFITKPKVLLIDELSLGLAPTIVGMLCDKVREINATGTTVVVVEQSVNVAMQLARRAVFLEKGAVRFEGPTGELLDRPDILRSVFIGGAAADPGHASTNGHAHGAPAPVPSRDVALHLNGLTKRFGGITAVDGVDLTIEPGTIVGLIGHNGAGKTTLFDLISGFLTPNAGTITLGDVDITTTAPHQRAAIDLGRSFQEARLFPSLTVEETIVVALDRHAASHDWVAAATALPAAVDSDAHSYRRAHELMDLLGLNGFKSTPIADLSTGTRRIVELACTLAMDPAVLLLDEPSAGVAQKDTEALGPLLRRIQAETGTSIVIIEHDMPLLTSLCDRLVALDTGSVIFEGPPDDVLEHPLVVQSYLGVDDAAINRSGSGDTVRRSDPARANGRRRTPLVAAGRSSGEG